MDSKDKPFINIDNGSFLREIRDICKKIPLKNKSPVHMHIVSSLIQAAMHAELFCY